MRICLSSTFNQSIFATHREELYRFLSRQEVAFTVCKDVIEDEQLIVSSNLYVCFVGERLCYTCTDKSMVEREYKVARSNQIPCVALLLDGVDTHDEQVNAFVDMLAQNDTPIFTFRGTSDIKVFMMSFIESPASYQLNRSILKEKKRNKPLFFISYSRRDYPLIYQTLQLFLSNEISFWIDIYIQPRQDWVEEIEKHLVSCRYMVIFLSRNSIKSYWVQKEYRTFFGIGKEIIPIICEPDHIASFFEVFPLLSSIQHIKDLQSVQQHIDLFRK